MSSVEWDLNPDEPPRLRANEHQDFEAAWWGDCANTFREEQKQLTYARHMGLTAEEVDGHWPVYRLGGRSVIDIGGGPASLLLKCVELPERGCYVVDPCVYPAWVYDRYERHGIQSVVMRGEDVDPKRLPVDEVWIYNVLQHVDDPERICHVARSLAKVIRIFDWINIEPHLGHPHKLDAMTLNRWLDGQGEVVSCNGENGCTGMAYVAVVGSAGH